MSISLSVPELTELRPRITVFGVGGAGGNAVNNMIRSELEGVEFVVANTDAQALAQSGCERRIQMGVSITEGLGAGSRPEVGRAAAQESIEEIMDHLSGCHMVFITAGMGGGTGTGAAPVIAQAAREQGILTVGVVTKPFQFEGGRRMRIAENGIEEFQRYADTLLIIPNQNLFRIANENTTFADAFAMADEVLHSGVRGITDLMVMPGLINLDFADVRAVMNEMGKAMMGTGEASGEKRAVEAAEAAIANPLLDDVSMKGARGVLINITGGPDLGLYEVDEAANRIRSEVDADANIIVGSTFCDRLEGAMRVSVVATGIDVLEQTEEETDGAHGSRHEASWQSANGNENVSGARPPVHAMTEAIEKRLTSSVPGSAGSRSAAGEGTAEDSVGDATQASAPSSPPPNEAVKNDASDGSGAYQTQPKSGVSLGANRSFTGFSPTTFVPHNHHGGAAGAAGVAVQQPAVSQREPYVEDAANEAPQTMGEAFESVVPPSGEAQSRPADPTARHHDDAHPTGQDNAQRRRGGTMTVFEKMMEGVRQARQTNRPGPAGKRPLDPGSISTEARYPANSDSPPEQGPAQDGNARDSSAQDNRGDGLFGSNENEEQLEIPAFLRRAN